MLRKNLKQCEALQSLTILGRFTPEKKNNSKTTPVKKANRISLSTGLHLAIFTKLFQPNFTQATKPADLSELISDDETRLLILRQPEGRTEDFTKAMADLGAHSSKSRPRMQPASAGNNLAHK